MIFARSCLPALGVTQLTSLLGRANLDLLQFDMAAPMGGQTSDGEMDGWRALAGILPHIHTAIYLRPELSVVSNAGYHNVINSVTSLADYLVSHGSADLLLAAVRGDNLLSELNTILPAASLPENADVVSARVELGGGPFATAFAEGARFVMAGSYDISAPLFGAAAAHGLCGWQDYQRIATLAAASHFEDVIVETNAEGLVELEPAASEQLDKVCALGAVEHADVHVEYSALALEPTHRNTLRPAGVRSFSTSDVWNVRVVVTSGFQGTAVIVGAPKKLSELVSRLPLELRDGSTTCTEYHPAVSNATDDSALVRIEYHAPSCEMCREFLEWLQSSLRKKPAIGQIIAPLPAVERSTETISVQIPADAVTVSVDTRPAREWR